MKTITDLQKEEIVEFYNNKTDWTIEEVEAFENKLIKIYNEDSDFFDSISGFNDNGYGKYSTASDDYADWGIDGIFNNKRYSTHDIIDITKVDGKNPFVTHCDDSGLMKQFKQNIGIK